MHEEMEHLKRVEEQYKQLQAENSVLEEKVKILSAGGESLDDKAGK